MTFGGLALGIGMIVDAAIVVLENTHRHLHMGKDRMTAAIEGSEEVWSAILASTLTHIAVFIPLLFLSGTASIMFTQLSVVVMFSLAMSALRRRHDRAGALLPLAAHAGPGSRAIRHHGCPVPGQRALSRAHGRSLPEGHPRALSHRPTVMAAAAALVAAAVVIYPRIGVEQLPRTDEGEVNVNVELAVGTRIEPTEAALLQL
jgi:HAE1 family hydrophobic/amphiphilic exporter-1